MITHFVFHLLDSYFILLELIKEMIEYYGWEDSWIFVNDFVTNLEIFHGKMWKKDFHFVNFFTRLNTYVYKSPVFILVLSFRTRIVSFRLTTPINSRTGSLIVFCCRSQSSVKSKEIYKNKDVQLSMVLNSTKLVLWKKLITLIEF